MMLMFADPLIGAISVIVLCLVLYIFIMVNLYRSTRKALHRRIMIITSGVVCTGVMVLLSFVVKDNAGKAIECTEMYKQALELEKDGNYLYAYWTYEDINEKISNVTAVKNAINRMYLPGNYAIGELYMEEGNYYGAMVAFNRVSEYRDAEEKADECMLLHLQREHPDWFK